MAGALNPYITPSGYWGPVLWLIAFLLSLLLAYVIWSRGEKSYKKGSEQVKPFYAGNVIKPRERAHIRSHNIYWGFVEALKPYYEGLRRIHTGDVNDYVAWLIGVTSFMLIIYFLWGVRP